MPTEDMPTSRKKIMSLNETEIRDHYDNKMREFCDFLNENKNGPNILDLIVGNLNFATFLFVVAVDRADYSRYKLHGKNAPSAFDTMAMEFIETARKAYEDSDGYIKKPH